MALSDSRTDRRPCWRRLGPRPPARPGPPSLTTDPLPCMPCSLPRWTEQVLLVALVACSHAGVLPCSCSLPRFSGGSASTPSLSRPAQASHALRPARLLTHLSVGFITRLRPCRFPGSSARKLSSPTNNYWSGSSPHWRSAPSRRTEKGRLDLLSRRFRRQQPDQRSARRRA
jgi:hypothetical protein